MCCQFSAPIVRTVSFDRQRRFHVSGPSHDILDESVCLQVPLSRKFRSLKIWFTMRAFGLDKVRGHIRRHTKHARDFEAMVKTDDR